jgi:hypothetical protein
VHERLDESRAGIRRRHQSSFEHGATRQDILGHRVHLEEAVIDTRCRHKREAMTAY